MKRWVLYLLLLFLIIPPAHAEFPKLTLITEQYQPYNFVDPNDPSGRVQGIAVDLLLAMLDRVGSDQTRDDIRMAPWARGYLLTQNQANTVLFSTTRTKQRETLFKWVCPIGELRNELIALKSANITISDPADIMNYKIGTVHEDVGEQLLLDMGVPLSALSRTTQYQNNVEKLLKRRIHLYAGGLKTVESICKASLNCTSDQFESVYTLDASHLCYAFNIGTDDHIIQSLQQALDQLIAQGELERLKQRYAKWQ